MKKFVFLGFEFRPRRAKSKFGKLFLNFNPAASREAINEMYQKIRNWRLHKQTSSTLEKIAQNINPVVSGWLNYYGRFYKSALHRIINHIDWKLVRWTTRKYKKMKGSQRRATKWFNRFKGKEPGLFAHW